LELKQAMLTWQKTAPEEIKLFLTTITLPIKPVILQCTSSASSVASVNKLQGVSEMQRVTNTYEIVLNSETCTV